MKRSKIIAAAALTAVLGAQSVLLTGCSGTEISEKFTMPEIKNYTTYDNGDFSDYSVAGTVKSELLPNQWLEYGAGDPFVMRHNGMYYLYVSTRDEELGVRAWKSGDMLHWEKCTGVGLRDGFVSEDPITVSAYAPEVNYFNGKFYMYTSPAGNGHYTLVSDSPEGPFVKATDNYGMSIDGSVFMDDDETIYFMNAGTGGIEIRKMDSFGALPGRATKLDNTSMGWTEGPLMIKRDGHYYMTFTGIHVLSPAYKVGYVHAKDGESLIQRDSFTDGVDNPVLLDVDNDNNFKGLGHSSTVLGPDMDSYYIAYHSLNSVTNHGPWRSFNFDRLIFNGSQMSVDASKTDSIAPALPAFAAAEITDEKFDTSGGKTLSKTATSAVFTAEYNFTGDKVKCIAGYVDDNNYCYATADYGAKTVSLRKVTNGTDGEVAVGTLKNDFDANVLHTVRIAYADGKCDVYFDNMRKIADAETAIPSGKIGYEGGGSIGYTAFSGAARGYSDRAELKQSGANIGASNYLPDGAYDGVTSYKFGKGSGLSTVAVDRDEYPDDASYDGARQLTLKNKGDYARYATYFRESGHYGLALTFDAKYAGRKIGVSVNGGDVQTVTLPSVAVDGDDYLSNIVSATVAEFDAQAGANIITLYGVDEFAFISFTMHKKAYGDFEFVNDLREVVDRGAIYSSMYRIIDDGHATRSGNRMLAYFGDDTITDCEIEVKMRFLSENVYGAGLVFRAGNYATSNHDDNTSIQGYYLGIKGSLVSLSKYNFNYTRTNLRFEPHGVRENITEHWFRLKAVVKGNTLTVYLDDKQMFSFTDPHPFLSGHFGLYSEGAEVVYKNLIIRGL